MLAPIGFPGGQTKFFYEILESGVWIPPPLSQFSMAYVEAIGGGGGGSGSPGGSIDGGGGGGGGFNFRMLPLSFFESLTGPIQVVIGAGGAAGVNANGADGGATYFAGLLLALGGQGGFYNATTVAASGDFVGEGLTGTKMNAWPSGSGGAQNVVGGSCIKGGAGGGGSGNSSTGRAGGVSIDGGNGGTGRAGNGNAGDAGSQPGGGGGASQRSTGGAGGAGRVRIWLF